MPSGSSRLRVSRSSNVPSMQKYGKYSLPASSALRSAAPRVIVGELRGRDHPGHRTAEIAARQPGEFGDRRGVLTRGEVIGRSVATVRLTELVGGVGDVVDGDDVDGRRRDRRHRGEQPAGERAQRPVQNIERGGPAVVAVADDDAGAQDRVRQAFMRAHELLGLELGLLVGVVERLADIGVALGEHRPRDRRRRTRWRCGRSTPGRRVRAPARRAPASAGFPRG